MRHRSATRARWALLSEGVLVLVLVPGTDGLNGTCPDWALDLTEPETDAA